LISSIMMFPLCGSGDYDVVSFPELFKGATMEIRACGLDVDKDGHEDVVLLHSGGQLIKAMMPHEFLEALYPDHEKEEDQ